MDFSKVAPYLRNPLVLVGFVLFLFFGIHRALIRSNILPPVSATASSHIVRLLLHYGFVIALLILLSGFGIEALKEVLHSKEKHEEAQAQVLVEHEKLEAARSKPLNRVAAEELLQKHRGSIEQCLTGHSTWTFLNFVFQGRPDGGLNVDIFSGTENVLNLGHLSIPPGTYTREQFQKSVDAREPHARRGQQATPEEKAEFRKMWFELLGESKSNRIEEVGSLNGHSVWVRALGSKLGVTDPRTNGCILGVLSDSFSSYTGTLNDEPLIHRYVTDSGTRQATINKPR